MLNFCTLFNTFYLTRGLAMYESLLKHCIDFHLYIFAFDDFTFKYLENKNFRNVTVISLKEFEDPELLKVKPTRSLGEYCWTSTSSTILYVLNNFEVEHCTYIDADLIFYSNPKVLVDEMGSKSVLLTLHRYTKDYNVEHLSGKYCVQFLTVKNDVNGLKAVNWWRERCLEWCFARYEDGKFGDQKYLDDWTNRFDGIHVLENLGGGVAPWNIQQYQFYFKNNILGNEISTKKDFYLIFYHFHYVRFFQNGKIELGRFLLDENIIQKIYKPYIQRLFQLENEIKSLFPEQNPNGITKFERSWKTPLINIYRKFKKVFHVYNLNDFLK